MSRSSLGRAPDALSPRPSLVGDMRSRPPRTPRGKQSRAVLDGLAIAAVLDSPDCLLEIFGQLCCRHSLR